MNIWFCFQLPRNEFKNLYFQLYGKIFALVSIPKKSFPGEKPKRIANVVGKRAVPGLVSVLVTRWQLLWWCYAVVERDSSAYTMRPAAVRASPRPIHRRNHRWPIWWPWPELRWPLTWPLSTGRKESIISIRDSILDISSQTVRYHINIRIKIFSVRITMN